MRFAICWIAASIVVLLSHSASGRPGSRPATYADQAKTNKPKQSHHPSQPPATGFILRHRAKVGATIKYRLQADMDIQGQSAFFTSLLTEKTTDVAPGGLFTVETKTSQATVTMGGKTTDVQAKSTTRTTYRSDGEVVKIVSEPSDPATQRMANMQSMRFPPTRLKVGDSWKVHIQGDTKGSADANGVYKVEAREKVGKHDTYRIHVSMKETASTDPLGNEGTVWIDVSDGSAVKVDVTFTNAPIPQMGPTTMKMKLTREG
jgi:hypothetical protein